MDLSRALFQVSRIGISEIVMPNTFYNITSANNTISVNEGGGAQTVTITAGFYDIDTLLDALKTALDADGTLTGVFTCSYSTITYKVTIASTVANSIVYGQLADDLGFMVTTGSATSHTATRVFDINKIKEIYILSTINTNHELNSKRQSILGKVVLNGSFGEVIVSKNESVNYINLESPQDIGSLNFQLIDNSHNVLSNNDLEWSMTIDYS